MTPFYFCRPLELSDHQGQELLPLNSAAAIAVQQAWNTNKGKHNFLPLQAWQTTYKTKSLPENMATVYSNAN